MASPIEDSERVLQGDSSEAKGCCARFKPTRKIFTKYVLLRVLGLSLYVFDMLTDISVAYTDYKAGDYIFSYITIGLVFAPGVLFSFYLFCEYFLLYIGEISCLKALLWVLSSPFLPVWVVLRDIKQIIEGIIATLIPAKRNKIIEKLNQPSRAYLLKFLEAFTEAAPQLVVRLYRIATRSPQQFSDIRTTEAVQISLSLLILSLKVVSTHQRSVSTQNVIEGHNEPHSEQTLPWYLQIVALIWWMCFLITRFQALALFSASYDLWVLLVIGIHVLLIFLFQTIADYKNIMKRIFTYLFGAFVFIFAYIQFNMHTRMKIAVWFPYTIYAILLFVENSIMMTFWYFDQRKQIELLNSTIIITNKPRPILGAKTTTSLPNNVGAVPSVADLQFHSKLLLFLHYGIFGVGLFFMIILFTCAAICNKNQDTEDRKKQEPIEMQTLMTG